MNLRIEIRYAVLISLLMLLWLSLEFMIGLHDTFIDYHPYVTMLALIIPVVCSRLALTAKKEELNNKLTFKQAFATGFLTSLFAAILSIPVQLTFHFLINPDFFDNMIANSVKHAELMKMHVAQAKLQAQQYFSLNSYIVMSFFGTLIFGTIIAFVMARIMRTE